MAVQDTDTFLVNRNNTSYQVESQNLMSIQDTDLMLVNRGGQSYKVTGSEVKDALGGSLPKFNINDCFNSFEYQGNGGSQTFNVGFDCSQGCLILIGDNGNNTTWFADTVSGVNKLGVWWNSDGAKADEANSVTSFTSTGFTIGNNLKINYNGRRYQVNVFKKHTGFFDMVSYTGSGGDRQIAHNLGAPPCMVITRNQSAYNTNGWHASTGIYGITRFNTTASASNTTNLNTAYPTDTYLNLGNTTENNQSGRDFIAYLFGGAPAGTADYPVIYGSYTGSSGMNCVPTGGTKAQFVYFNAISIANSQSPGIYIDKNVIEGSPNFGSGKGWNFNRDVAVSGKFIYNPTDIKILGTDPEYNKDNASYYYYLIGTA